MASIPISWHIRSNFHLLHCKQPKRLPKNNSAAKQANYH